MDSAAVRTQIRNYILEQFLPGEDPDQLKDDTPLTATGILDSVSTLKLISYVEDTFGITVEPHEASSAFATVEDILALLAQKLR